MSRGSVDLPHPDGPMSETNSPSCTVRSMPVSAVTVAPLAPVKIRSTPRTTTASDVRRAEAVSAAATGSARRPAQPCSRMTGCSCDGLLSAEGAEEGGEEGDEAGGDEAGSTAPRIGAQGLAGSLDAATAVSRG